MRLLSLYPGIMLLLMSRHTVDVITHHGVLDEGIHFTQKSATIIGLADRVREAQAEGGKAWELPNEIRPSCEKAKLVLLCYVVTQCFSPA